MPYIRPNSLNPFGLTLKQRLFIEGIVKDIINGKKINPSKSAEMVYQVKNHNTAKSIASENLTKPNVINALNYLLEKRGITGSEGKINKKLTEGLGAVIVTGVDNNRPIISPDFITRLEYIREINKIINIY